MTTAWGSVGARDVVELFYDPARDLPDAEDCAFLLYGSSRGPNNLAAIRQFQQEVAPQYFDLPMEQRLEAGRAYCLSGHSRRHPDAAMFEFLISGAADIQLGEHTFCHVEGYSLIHSIAISLGRTYREGLKCPAKCDTEREGRWLRLLGRALGEPRRQTIHLVEHVRDQYSIDVGKLPFETDWIGTPLLSVLQGCVAESLWDSNMGADPLKQQWKEWQSILACTLEKWLTYLSGIGVDLAEYGRLEQEILSSMAGDALDFTWASSWWSVSDQATVTKRLPVRLRRLEFDTRPSGWLLVWDLDIEKLAGEFWGLIEEEAVVYTRIPGQWVD